MIELIVKLIFLSTIWSLGWKVVTAKGMLLEKIGEWGDKKVEDGYKIFEGLITCPFCIPNIHSLLFVYPLAFIIGIMPFEFNWEYVAIYPFCVSGSSFLSGAIWTVYLTLNAKKDYYEKMEEKTHLEIKNMKQDYHNKKQKYGNS